MVRLAMKLARCVCGWLSDATDTLPALMNAGSGSSRETSAPITPRS